MPKIIKKYKLKSKFDNESEFLVTRIKVVESKTTMRTDDEGYAISDRESPKKETITKYGISAISLPSKSQATVIPLEVEDVNEQQALAVDGAVNRIEYNEVPPKIDREANRPRPVNAKHLMENDLGPKGKPAPINLTKVMEGGRPVVAPKNDGITWADDSDQRSDNPIQPF